MVGQKKTGPSGRFFSKCTEVADTFAAGHSLAPVAMMLVAGTHSKRDEDSERVEGTVDGWLHGSTRCHER